MGPDWGRISETRHTWKGTLSQTGDSAWFIPQFPSLPVIYHPETQSRFSLSHNTQQVTSRGLTGMGNGLLLEGSGYPLGVLRGNAAVTADELRRHCRHFLRCTTPDLVFLQPDLSWMVSATLNIHGPWRGPFQWSTEPDLCEHLWLVDLCS